MASKWIKILHVSLKIFLFNEASTNKVNRWQFGRNGSGAWTDKGLTSNKLTSPRMKENLKNGKQIEKWAKGKKREFKEVKMAKEIKMWCSGPPWWSSG